MKSARIILSGGCAVLSLVIFGAAIVRGYRFSFDLTFWKLQAAGWALLCAANVLG